MDILTLSNTLDDFVLNKSINNPNFKVIENILYLNDKPIAKKDRCFIIVDNSYFYKGNTAEVKVTDIMILDFEYGWYLIKLKDEQCLFNGTMTYKLLNNNKIISSIKEAINLVFNDAAYYTLKMWACLAESKEFEINTKTGVKEEYIKYGYLYLKKKVSMESKNKFYIKGFSTIFFESFIDKENTLHCYLPYNVNNCKLVDNIGVSMNKIKL